MTAVVRDTAGLAALRGDWDRLYTATGETNPFLRWDWAWHWWHRACRRRGWPRSRLHVLVLRDPTDQARAIIPFLRTHWGIVRSLRLFGFWTGLLDLRTPLVWPGWETTTAAALADVLDRQRPLYDLCVLDGLADDDPLTHALGRHVDGREWRWGPSLDACYVPLPRTWNELKSGLSRNNRGSVQQGYNALRRDGLQHTFEVVAEPAAILPALEELFALHRARAARPSGPRHADYYARHADREFLRRLAADLAPRGLLRVCRLRVDGHVVASRVVLSAGRGLYLYHAGHDPDWGRYRVGTLLTAECIQMAIAAGAQFVHLGTSLEESKRRWSPRVCMLRELFILPPTPRGRWLGRVALRVLGLSRVVRPWRPQDVWRAVWSGLR